MAQGLSVALIVEGLETAFMGRHVRYYPSLPSTMDEARQVALAGAPEGTLVIAEEQTLGRGRLGRAWFSPQGCLALSLVLRPSRRELSSLVMVASLAVVQSIENITPLRAQIKWPNDVLIKGRKVAGILIESALRGDAVDYCLLGIGINVNLDTTSIPEIASFATSLSQELGREVSLLGLLRTLMGTLERYYLMVRGGGDVLDAWRQRLETMGQWIKVSWDEGKVEGWAESVDEEGALLLRLRDGRLLRIPSGEVTVLR